MERLDKILSNMGFGTRKEVKQLIKNKEVSVDGVTAVCPDLKVDPDKSEIAVKNEPLIYKKHIYLMLNKPKGYVSATQDNLHKTVADLVPERFSHYKPFPVGRLDIDTEGFVLLTNDGALAHELAAPKRHVPKTYFAMIDGEISQNDISVFQSGIVLDDGYKTLPAVLKKSGDGVFVTIYEGKFHQIKRMFKALGKNVTYLKRIKISGLELDPDLKPGETREITEEEQKKLWT